MLIKGITDYSKACVLIALKNMFTAAPYYGSVDWGEDFLVDYFVEFGQDGFNSDHFYLIAESAPVFILPNGSYTAHYAQEDGYFRIYNRKQAIRYRLPGNRNIILCYRTITNGAHAVCIPASEFTAYINKYEYLVSMFPNYGLIVDHRTYEQDFPNGQKGITNG